MRDVLAVLAGVKPEEVPDPQRDMAAFKAAYNALESKLPMPHNILHTGRTPWIDVAILEEHFKHLDEPIVDDPKANGCVIS